MEMEGPIYLTIYSATRFHAWKSFFFHCIRLIFWHRFCKFFVRLVDLRKKIFSSLRKKLRCYVAFGKIFTNHHKYILFLNKNRLWISYDHPMFRSFRNLPKISKSSFFIFVAQKVISNTDLRTESITYISFSKICF